MVPPGHGQPLPTFPSSSRACRLKKIDQAFIQLTTNDAARMETPLDVPIAESSLRRLALSKRIKSENAGAEDRDK